MSTIQGGISIANMTPLKNQTPIDLKDHPELLKRTLEAVTHVVESMRTPAEMAAQKAKQDAVEAHSVYRVNGDIVAVHYQDGTSSMRNDAAGARGDAEKIGRAAGLSGDALNDFVAAQMTQALRQQYGSALTVEQYEPGSAPKRIDLAHEMNGGAIPPPAPFDNQLYTALLERQEQLSRWHAEVNGAPA